MKNGKRGVLKRISVNAKTWVMIERTDTYTCHAGKKLQPIFLKKQTSKSGYESKVTVYECEDCTGCPL